MNKLNERGDLTTSTVSSEFLQLLSNVQWSKSISFEELMHHHDVVLGRAVNEAKHKPSIQPPISNTDNKILDTNIKYSSLYDDQLRKHKHIENKIAFFINLRKQSPTGVIPKDTPLVSKGPFGDLKLRHYHLDLDLSMFYRVAGTPATLYLYGVFSHKEAGTVSNPAKVKSFVSKLSNEFPELKNINEDEIELLKTRINRLLS